MNEEAQQIHDYLTTNLKEYSVELNQEEYPHPQTEVIVTDSFNVEVIYCDDHVLLQTNGSNDQKNQAWFTWYEENAAKQILSKIKKWSKNT